MDIEYWLLCGFGNFKLYEKILHKAIQQFQKTNQMWERTQNSSSYNTVECSKILFSVKFKLPENWAYSTKH